jgi:uncharacterized membrane protein
MALLDTGPGTSRVFDPPFPRSRGEYITILAHYHRAEIARMAGWRDRIDRTTNWAITVCAAMLSLTFSTPTAHHSVLLFGMLLVLLLLLIEARRYRFFDVYRRRVRSLERNYYAQVFNPTKDVPPQWARILGEDLARPAFLITHRRAMSRRLKRNYIWMFLLMALAWVLKISAGISQAIGEAGAQPGAARSWYAGADIGPVPGMLVIAALMVFYAWLLYTAFWLYRGHADAEDGMVHV